MSETDREKQAFIQKMMEKKVNTIDEKRTEERKDWIKTSFWAPDNTPMTADKAVKAPSKEMYCPAIPVEDKEHAHPIRMKDLIPLKLDENDLHEYVCWICQKALVHQKISVLKKCGHVSCRECILKFALQKDSKEGRCMKCD